MRAALEKNKPAGWTNFKDSKGWRQKFFERFNSVFRDTTNTKPLTEQRLDKVVTFYKYFRQVCLDDPQVCDVYGARIECTETRCDSSPVAS